MKVLVIRFSSIGDIVLTTPVLRCLKIQLGAEVHYLTKKAYAQIVEPNPHVSKVFTIERSIRERIGALRKERYDVVVDLHKNIRSLGVQLYLLRRALRLRKANWQKWQMVMLKKRNMQAVHIVDRYLATVSNLGVVDDGLGLDYFLPEETKLPTEVSGRYVCFAIGGAHDTKRMPIPHWQKLSQRFEVPVYVLGGKEDRVLGDQLSRQYSKTYNMCGALSLAQSALLISKSSAVITHDTGMMHIAAAYNRPIVSIWGSTVPEFGMTPWRPIGLPAQDRIMEVHGLPCRPCSKIGFRSCPKKHFACMEKQNVDMIAEGARQIIIG